MNVFLFSLPVLRDIRSLIFKFCVGKYLFVRKTIYSAEMCDTFSPVKLFTRREGECFIKSGSSQRVRDKSCSWIIENIRTWV